MAQGNGGSPGGKFARRAQEARKQTEEAAEREREREAERRAADYGEATPTPQPRREKPPRREVRRERREGPAPAEAPATPERQEPRAEPAEERREERRETPARRRPSAVPHEEGFHDIPELRSYQNMVREGEEKEKRIEEVKRQAQELGLKVEERAPQVAEVPAKKTTKGKGGRAEGKTQDLKKISTVRKYRQEAPRAMFSGVTEGAERIENVEALLESPEFRSILGEYKMMKGREIEREVRLGLEDALPDRAYQDYMREVLNGRTPAGELPQRVVDFARFYAARVETTPGFGVGMEVSTIRHMSNQESSLFLDAHFKRAYDEYVRKNGIFRTDRGKEVGEGWVENRIDEVLRGERSPESLPASVRSFLGELSGVRRGEPVPTPPETSVETPTRAPERAAEEPAAEPAARRLTPEEQARYEALARERGVIAPAGGYSPEEAGEALAAMARREAPARPPTPEAARASLDAPLALRGVERRAGVTAEDRDFLDRFGERWRRIRGWKKIAVGVGLFGIGVAGAAAGGWLGATVAGIAYFGGRTLSAAGAFATVDGLTKNMRNRGAARSLSIGAGLAAFLAVPAIAQYLNSEFGLGQKIRGWLGMGEAPGTTKKVPEAEKWFPVDEPESKGKPIPEAPDVPTKPDAPVTPEKPDVVLLDRGVPVVPGDGPSMLIERALTEQGMSRKDVLKTIYHLQGKIIEVDHAADPKGRVWKIIATPEQLAKWKIDPSVLEGLKNGQSIGKSFDISGMLADPEIQKGLPKGVKIPEDLIYKTPPAEGVATLPAEGKGGGAGLETPQRMEEVSENLNLPDRGEGIVEKDPSQDLSEAQKRVLENQKNLLAFEYLQRDVRDTFKPRGFFASLFGSSTSGLETFKLHDWRTVSSFLRAENLPKLTVAALEDAQEYLKEGAKAYGIDMNRMTVRNAFEAIAKAKAEKELNL